jgi:prepilin-type N-terminal cleavage/methylation domain-containing protein
MVKTNQAGMTLLEVIVALVILSLGLAALFDTVSLGTRTASVADRHRAADAAAQSLLAELGRSRPIVDGISTGECATGQSWQLDIEPLEAASAASGILQGHRVRLTVSWPDPPQGRSILFDTLMLTAVP